MRHASPRPAEATRPARFLTLILAGLLATGAAAEEEGASRWPRFRGPNGSGLAGGDVAPVHFGPAQNRLWKIPVPAGHSSPIVWDDHLFLTAIEDETLLTLAISVADGRLLWRREVKPEALEEFHPFSSLAAPTAATDGRRVYAYFGSYGVVAYDFEGATAWTRPLEAPGTSYGASSSPILAGDKLILQRDSGKRTSEVVALGTATGEVVWRAERPLLGDSYSTPVVWSQDGEDQIVTAGASKVVAHAATTGERLWWAGALTPNPVPLPVIGDGLLFASAVFGGSSVDPIDVPTWDELISDYDDGDGQLGMSEIPADAGFQMRKEVPIEAPGNFLEITRVMELSDGNQDGTVTSEEFAASMESFEGMADNVVAIRPGGRGDCTATHIAWKADRGLSEMPSPVYHDGRLVFVRDGGVLTVYAAATGEIALDRRRLGAGGQYVASPVIAGDRVYASSIRGTVVVFQVGDDLEVLARNDLGERITATPAIAGGRLFVRSEENLWAFGSPGGE